MRNGSTIRQRQLARMLRQLREEAGLTLEEAAPRLDWSTSKLGRIETARQGVDVLSVGMHPGLDGSFSVLGFDEPDEPPIAYMENAATALYLEKEAEVRACRLVFDRLRSEALSPRDSVALVERLADDL